MESENKIPVWPLPLLSALLTLTAIHLAWWISVSHGYVPSCFPYIDGCTSISRAARYGLANQVFKIIMIFSVILQIFTWSACEKWLLRAHVSGGKILSYLGLIAGVFLSLYIMYLGTDGLIYQLMRRYGILIYFGATYVAQLFLHLKLRAVTRSEISKAMTAICLVLFPLSLLGLFLSILTKDLPMNDSLENIIEWNLTLLISMWFVLLSIEWRKQKLYFSKSSHGN